METTKNDLEKAEVMLGSILCFENEQQSVSVDQ
jgi:hypothetical protein